MIVVGGGSVEDVDDWTYRYFDSATRVTAWAAQDYRLSGGVPFAGLVPTHRHVYAATGFNKWGMTNAVAAAHAMTSEILGEPKSWAEELKRHFGDVSQTTRTVSSVAGRLVKDWLDAEATPASAAERLGEGQGVVVREGMMPVAVSRVQGKACRVSGVCTHLGGVLEWNEQEQSWDCPLHGSRFTPEGEVLEGPAVDPLT